MWDFQTALGDTIREKYESEYVKVIEIDGIPVYDMKNFWLDRRKNREAADYWNEFSENRKMAQAISRYRKKGKK